MAENRVTPPLQKPVREFALPEHVSGFFVELVDRSSDRYQSVYPIKRGTPYATVRGGDTNVSASFAPLYFLKENRVANSDTLVNWVWATDQFAQDSYNSEHSFSGESLSHPVFARVSHVRRDLWDAGTAQLAFGTALTALIAIKVTAGGTAYAATDTVAISGSLGGAAELVVDASGTITHVIVTNGGSGYDSASLPTVTITTSTGSGATLVAVVQPKTAVLVSQRKQELGHDSSFTSQSTDSPYSSHFVRVIRVYEVLPGPVLTTTDRNSDVRGRTLTITEQRVAPGTAPETGDLIIRSTVTPADGNSNVSVRRTTSIASLPVDEVSYGEQPVSIPTRIILIVFSLACGGSPYASVVRHTTSKAGGSFMRKHRTTVQYRYAAPDETGVWRITITNGGSGYTSAPAVGFTGGGGSGATAIAVVSGGVVTSILITNEGTGYTSNPTVGFTGGGGASAAATAEAIAVANRIKTGDVQYDGKYVSFSYNNVLSDGFVASQAVTTTGPSGNCTYTDTVTIAATSPSASAFDNAWYLLRRTPEPFGDSMWKITTTEFFEPQD